MQPESYEQSPIEHLAQYAACPVLACLLIASLIGLFGCSAISSSASTPSARHQAATLAGVSLAQDSSGVPDIHHAGLEAVGITSRLSSAVIAHHLQDFLGRPTGLDERAQHAWQANGLRVIAVPKHALNPILDTLSRGSIRERQWLGQLIKWTPLATTPTPSSGQTISLDAERLELGPGEFRLMARAWTAPSPPQQSEQDPRSDFSANVGGSGPRAVLVLELLPVHTPRFVSIRPFADIESLTVAESSRVAIQDSLILDRLALHLLLSDEDALLIVPELPDADWSDPESIAQPHQPEPRSQAEQPQPPANPPLALGQVSRSKSSSTRRPDSSSSSDIGTAPSAGTSSVDLSPAGPKIAAFPTFGQALLMPPASSAIPAPVAKVGIGSSTAPAPTPTRRIIVLIPRLPEHFRLAPSMSEE